MILAKLNWFEYVVIFFSFKTLYNCTAFSLEQFSYDPEMITHKHNKNDKHLKLTQLTQANLHSFWLVGLAKRQSAATNCNLKGSHFLCHHWFSALNWPNSNNPFSILGILLATTGR